jgi:frataxin-like iron-binding protein CyaY
MDDKRFQQLAEIALKHSVNALDSFEELGVDDLGDTVRIELPDRRRLVVTRHTAARPRSLAAPAGARPGAPDDPGERWIDVRTGVELYAQLEELIESMLGKKVSLARS